MENFKDVCMALRGGGRGRGRGAVGRGGGGKFPDFAELCHPGGGAFPIMDYAGRSRPGGVPFSGSRCT